METVNIKQIQAEVLNSSTPALRQNVEFANEVMEVKERREKFDEEYYYWATLGLLSKAELKRREEAL